ncbi:MAG: pilus assembly protein PilP [Desulfosalsimonas sp.]
MAKSKKEKITMMTNRTLFITAVMFFLLPWCMGLGSAPENEDLHVSEEVEISRDNQPDGSGDEAVQEQSKSSESVSEQAGSAEENAEAEKKPEQEQQSPGQDTGQQSSQEELELGALMLDEQEALYGTEERYYTRGGRVDPFEPFIQRESSESEDQEGQEVERREPQTPLEKIALSQLKLTAVLRVSEEGRSMGMVEDKDGRGYVVRKGTYIGENGGQVEEVLRDRIIIQEKYKDVFGKIAVREIEKKLQN